LRKQLGDPTKRLLEGLIPDLDYYCSFVAGFASSASRLHDRPIEQLKKAIPKLEMSFFDQFPDYRHLESRITPENTPDLHRKLGSVDSVRIELAEIMRKFISESGIP